MGRLTKVHLWMVGLVAPALILATDVEAGRVEREDGVPRAAAPPAGEARIKAGLLPVVFRLVHQTEQGPESVSRQQLDGAEPHKIYRREKGEWSLLEDASWSIVKTENGRRAVSALAPGTYRVVFNGSMAWGEGVTCDVRFEVPETVPPGQVAVRITVPHESIGLTKGSLRMVNEDDDPVTSTIYPDIRVVAKQSWPDSERTYWEEVGRLKPGSDGRVRFKFPSECESITFETKNTRYRPTRRKRASATFTAGQLKAGATWELKAQPLQAFVRLLARTPEGDVPLTREVRDKYFGPQAQYNRPIVRPIEKDTGYATMDPGYHDWTTGINEFRFLRADKTHYFKDFVLMGVKWKVLEGDGREFTIDDPPVDLGTLVVQPRKAEKKAIEGRAVDGADGEPLEATVILVRNENPVASARAGEDGSFSMEVIKPEGTLLVRQRGYYLEIIQLDGKKTDVGEVSLKPMPRVTFQVSGVRDPEIARRVRVKVYDGKKKYAVRTVFQDDPNRAAGTTLPAGRYYAVGEVQPKLEDGADVHDSEPLVWAAREIEVKDDADNTFELEFASQKASIEHFGALPFQLQDEKLLVILWARWGESVFPAGFGVLGADAGGTGTVNCLGERRYILEVILGSPNPKDPGDFGGRTAYYTNVTKVKPGSKNTYRIRRGKEHSFSGRAPSFPGSE